MNVVVIASSGGSAFAEVAQICRHVGFRVITDRACGIEQNCRRLGIPSTRIEDASNKGFSAKASAEIETSGGCDYILTFFTRLLTEPLLRRFPALNIHPSLLPAFPGFNAVAQAKAAGERCIGATLHAIDHGIDAGPIVAQVSTSIDPAADIAQLEHVSFLQKVYLGLLCVELYERGHLRVAPGVAVLSPNLPRTSAANPALTDPRYCAAFASLQRAEGVAAV